MFTMGYYVGLNSWRTAALQAWAITLPLPHHEEDLNYTNLDITETTSENRLL